MKETILIHGRNAPAGRIRASAMSALLIVVALATAAGASSGPTRCIPASFPDSWLVLQERAGGRTLAMHVGRTDSQLVQRLANRPAVTATGSFSDMETAQLAITGYLSEVADEFNQWAATAPAGQRKQADATGSAIVGRVAYRPVSIENVRNTPNFRMVFTAVGNGGCVLANSSPVLASQQGAR